MNQPTGCGAGSLRSWAVASAWIVAAFALVVVSCSPAKTRWTVDGPTMGTSFRVIVSQPPEGFDSDGAADGIASTLERINSLMSTYLPDSELSRFNASVDLDWFAVSPETAAVCALAQEVSGETDGAFDVTVGPLVNLWGFGPEEVVEQLPSDEAVAESLRRVGNVKLSVRLDPPALKKDQADLYVDLSAIAKGYAVDQLAALLEKANCENYFVEVGGEVRTAGVREDGKAWNLAIEAAVDDRREVLHVLPVSGGAVASSGDYRNFFLHEGRRYSHEIDPHTGRPVIHELAATTVVAEDCAAADAWATALMVLGPEAGYDLAIDRDLAVLFQLRGEDGQPGEIRMTPRYEEMLNSAN